jgi:23S rRNA pseudouridine2605 synthase
MTEFKHLFEEARGPERIAKRLARAGLCSRREAERWIAEGRVSVDGKRLDTPAVTVDSVSRITVDGKPLPGIEPPRVWRYHKPRGLLTTDRDPEGRATVFEKLPRELPRVMSIGRLDMDSEGLLLLTNDGELSRLLELPSTAWVRRYRVRVFGNPEQGVLDRLKRGVTVDDIAYGPITATLDSQAPSNAWLTIGLREGKNREVRKVMDHLGLKVNRLIRVSYGPFQLGDMEPGQVEEVRRPVLKDQLGIRDAPKGEGRATARPTLKLRGAKPPAVKPPAGGAARGKQTPAAEGARGQRKTNHADRRRKPPRG